MSDGNCDTRVVIQLKINKYKYLLMEDGGLQRAYLVVLLSIMLSLFEALGVLSIMPFLAVVSDPNLIHKNNALVYVYNIVQQYGIETTNEFLIFLGIISFMIIIVAACLRTLTHLVISSFVEMRRHYLGYKILKSHFRLKYVNLIATNTSELNKMILSEVDQLIAYIIRPIVNLVSNLFVVFTLISLLFLVNYVVASLAIIVLGGLFFVSYILLRRYLSNLGRSITSANKDRFQAAQEALEGIKDIKIMGVEQPYLESFEKPSIQFARTHTKNVVLEQLPKYIVEAIAFGGLLILILIKIINYNNDLGSPLTEVLPLIGIYAFALYRLQPAVQAIYSAISNLRFGQDILENITHAMRYTDEPRESETQGTSDFKMKSAIRFVDASFGYPGTEALQLRNLNFEIPAGSKVAIIGQTGSGKSTIIDLILGLLEPVTGRVLIDNAALTQDTARQWQTKVGYLPQEVFLCDASINENIAFGIKKDVIDFTRVRYCAQIAKAASFIERELQFGYDTKIGQRGSKLSGGQKQRIGIARCLYKDPEVLILDEATSALDVVTEKKVIDSIQTHASGKTIIMVTHRMETIEQCDFLLEVKNGTVSRIDEVEQYLNTKV